MKIPIAVLQTSGTNCHAETKYAFELAGGAPKIVTVRSLITRENKLADFGIVVIPGGFSYGDRLDSGKVMSLEIIEQLAEDFIEFRNRGGLILGICNGFQVLVQTGLLPFGEMGKISVALDHNTCGAFRCHWVKLKILSATPFTRDMVGEEITLQIAHGEGRVDADREVIRQIEENSLAVLKYIDVNGEFATTPPANPNGSINSIAGMTDSSRQVFGLMPHPERSVIAEDHPDARRMLPLGLRLPYPHGLRIFENAVRSARES